MGMLIILIIFMIIGFAVQWKLKNKFKEYSQYRLSSNLTGREVAEKMLRDNGIYDVSVVSTEGSLTDHYNPATKTINLSEDVYNSCSVSAAAVAAHETGHAVQHAHAYYWLGLRSTLVPVVNVSSTIMNVIFIIGILGAISIHLFSFATVIYVLIFAQGAITLFSLVTLPVEYDASRRAVLWLEGARITNSEETVQAKDALKWAANTYLVAALAAVTQLLYYVFLLLARRD